MHFMSIPLQLSLLRKHKASAAYRFALRTGLACLIFTLAIGNSFHANADALDDKLMALRKKMDSYTPSDLARVKSDITESSAVGHSAFKAKRWTLSVDAFTHEARIAEIFGQPFPMRDRTYRGMAGDWKTLTVPNEMNSLIRTLSQNAEALEKAKWVIGNVGFDIDGLDTAHIAFLAVHAKASLMLIESKDRLDSQAKTDLGDLCAYAFDRFYSLPKKGAWRLVSANEWQSYRTNRCSNL